MVGETWTHIDEETKVGDVLDALELHRDGVELALARGGA